MSTQLFSRPCAYAIRALAVLAAQPVGRLVSAREIAQKTDMPTAFLGKVFLPLCREGFVRSRKGIGGGYELAADPEEVSILSIVRAVDGEPFRHCLLEDHPCSESRHCLLHPSWVKLREQWVDYLGCTTLADLARLQLEGFLNAFPTEAVGSR